MRFHEDEAHVGRCCDASCGGDVYRMPVVPGRRQHGAALSDPDEGGELRCLRCKREVFEEDVIPNE